MDARLRLKRLATLALSLMLYGAATGFAQVSPTEIANPRLKAAEKVYFTQLLDLNHLIARTEFPFKFALARYPGLDPKEQASGDTRGLEFILFHDRTVLKISGNYNAAFNAGLLTANQRADRVLEDVIVPVLRSVPTYFSSQSSFDGIGFEIAYHVRTRDGSYDYEGMEILTLVLDKADALAYSGAKEQSARQEILNRSQVYLNGKSIGLAIGSHDPLDLEALDKVTGSSAAPSPQEESASRPASPAAAPSSQTAPRFLNPARDLLQRYPTPSQGEARKSLAQDDPPATPAPGATDQAAANALQAKFQSQLDAWNKEGVERFHFVDYAPPSFMIFRNQIYLQITLRNPAAFDRNATSIYKRAAQSFDLFLAPVLKPLLDKVPRAEQIAGVGITVLNDLASGAAHSSEAVEFVCPLRPLQDFVSAEITNQDLINQSVVFVNGVRIGLNLQQVE